MVANDLERYSRQILFPGIGREGQEKLAAAHAVIAGCGALGSFLAGALARAGVGRLRIIDRDYVELSNLQRQWLFDEDDAAESLPKAIAAARKLARINSGVAVEPHVADLTSDNISELFDGASIILDGTDNFETRFLINDYAVSTSTPWIYGAAIASYGLSMPILPGLTACLACLYPEPPAGAQPTCETSGVIGPVTSLVASLQAAAALRVLTGAAEDGSIVTADLWTGDFRRIAGHPPAADCAVCRRKQFRYLQGAARAPISLCGRNAVQIHELKRPINLADLGARLAPLGTVRANEFALRFEAAPYLLTVFPDGRVIVKGTTDPSLARSVYARYIGA